MTSLLVEHGLKGASASIVAALGLLSTDSIVDAHWLVRSSQTRDQARVSCIGRRILYHWATREAPFSGVTEHFIWFHLPSLRTSIIFIKIYFTGCPRVCSLQCTSTTNTTLLSNNAVLLHDFQFVQLLSCGDRSDNFQSLYISQTRNLKYGYYFYLFSCLFIQQIFGCLLYTRYCSRYWRYSSEKREIMSVFMKLIY